jgi:hypothetical protein
MKLQPSQFRECCVAWLVRLATIVSVVDTFIGDLLAVVDQGVYGVVIEFNSFFSCIGLAESVDA